MLLTGVAIETLVDRRIDLTGITPFRDLVATGWAGTAWPKNGERLIERREARRTRMG
jgi:hypothetical protein